VQSHSNPVKELSYLISRQNFIAPYELNAGLNVLLNLYSLHCMFILLMLITLYCWTLLHCVKSLFSTILPYIFSLCSIYSLLQIYTLHVSAYLTIFKYTSMSYKVLLLPLVLFRLVLCCSHARVQFHGFLMV
jgi:hypothetical protein